MATSKMVISYRFDESVPRKGSIVHCFKTREALEDFKKLQGKGFGSVRFWKITGAVIRDEGGSDGWVIRVSEYKEIFLSPY